MKSNHVTREAWLVEGLKLLTPVFTENGFKVPTKVRVSCGFPSKNAFGARRQRIGECWSDSASKGKIFEIFISPVLSDPAKVLDVLAHEMVHATVGIACGHKGAFKSTALAIGLQGKMTQATAGPELLKRIEKVSKELGAFPHDELSQMTNGQKKEGCRQLKATCPGCGYVIRVTKKWIEQAGLPTCPCGEDFQEGDGE